MKAGLLSGDQVVASKNIATKDNGSGSSLAQSSGMVALSFNVPVYKSFRLGAEVGVNTFNQFMDKTFNFTAAGGNSSVKYLGYYRINQAYLAIVPEYRIRPWLFINAGAGYYNDFNSSFTNGTRIGFDIFSEDITGWSYKRFNAVGYFAGAGICPNITNQLALLVEFRYVGSPASTDSPDQIGIGYQALGFNIGLQYKPR